MLRGFFRRPAGPGWALIGDASHFKHPATAQGISDAIEQAIYVADALLEDGLDGYEAWRDERAAGHYEFSYQFGMLPRPELSGPIFDGITSDPQLSQDLRDSMSRRVRPSSVFSPENLQRWLRPDAPFTRPVTVAGTVASESGPHDHQRTHPPQGPPRRGDRDPADPRLFPGGDARPGLHGDPLGRPRLCSAA